MAAVGIGQIHGLQAHLSQCRTLVVQVIHLHICGHAHLLIHDEVCVAMQEAAELGQIGYHARQLAQVQVVDAQCEVLQGSGVGRGVDLQSRAVVCDEIQVGIDMVSLREHHVVVGVDVEGAVGDDGVERVQVYV